MSKVYLFAAFSLLATATFAAASSVEVLYVTETLNGKSSLLTYHVDPTTAVATKVGQPVSVGATSVDPVTVGRQHVLYVWNSTNVWTYLTNENGVPVAQPEQHLAFNFPHPVTAFVADPDGKFAYAGVSWWDSETENNYATVYLYTIDPSTGELTLEETAAQYGPNAYIGLTGFSFGLSGKQLFASFFNNGPFTCEDGYSSYAVNQDTGHLGSLETVVVNGSCSGTNAVAVTDQISGGAGGWSQGFGGISVLRSATEEEINCTPSMLSFCGDDVAVNGLYFDPASRNVFFADSYTDQIDIGRLNFTDGTITASDSVIPGNPKLYFSPDSLLVYSQYDNNIGIFAFRSSTGHITGTASLPVQGKATIATATLSQ
jgi:hypothetical protein